MAKGAKGPKFYAVAHGRDGPKIYEQWPDAERAVNGFKGATHCSFKSEHEALDWLARKTHTVEAVLQPLQETNSQPESSGLYRKKSDPTIEFKPRLTTRYAPYPTVDSRSASLHNALGQNVRGIPPVHPPRSLSSTSSRGLVPRSAPIASSSSSSSTSRPPTSSSMAQADAIPISSDVDTEDDMHIDEARTAASQSSNAATPRMSTTRIPQAPLSTPGTSTSEAVDLTTLASSPAKPAVVQPADQNPMEEKPPAVSETPVIPLSPEQQAILERVVAGESIFFTGSAGVGKSVVTRAIIKRLEAKYPVRNQIGITATTGIAATNIGGCTLHSWAGLGLAKMSVEKLFNGLNSTRKRDAMARWKECKVLIIDEVSMLHAGFFEKLEHIGRLARGNSRPFGGIQLVITGDFFQLPPVPDYQGQARGAGYSQGQKFVFESPAWKQAVPNMIVLTQVFRQRDDTFIRLLNEIRMGNASPEATKMFLSLGRKVHYDDGIEPTSLYSLRSAVLSENRRRLSLLKETAVSYTATDISGREKDGDHKLLYPKEEDLRAVLDKNTLVDSELTLKLGAQVMLVKNLQGGKLVNGSIGRVTGFTGMQDVRHANSPAGYKEEEEENPYGWVPDKDVQAQKEYEAWLAFEQGIESPPMEKKPVQGTSATQQPALPPPPSLQGVMIAQAALSERERKRRGLAPGETPETTEMDLQGSWPVVEFTNGMKVLMAPMEFSVENANGQIEATRNQIPLILAWALSIHKSQGQTLERVRVDLGDVFEKGQAYVALSRATRMETLQVLRFYPAKPILKLFNGIKVLHAKIDIAEGDVLIHPIYGTAEAKPLAKEQQKGKTNFDDACDR